LAWISILFCIFTPTFVISQKERCGVFWMSAARPKHPASPYFLSRYLLSMFYLKNLPKF
jgi:hypothetical protein